VAAAPVAPPPAPVAAPAPPRPAPAPEPEPEIIDVMPVELEPAVIDGLTRGTGYDQLDDAPSPGLLDGLQASGVDDAGFADAGSLLDLDTIDFGSPEANVSPLGGRNDGLLDFDMLPDHGGPPAPPPAKPPRPSLMDLPIIPDAGNPAASTVDEGPMGGDLDLIMPDQVTFDRGRPSERPAAPARPAAARPAPPPPPPQPIEGLQVLEVETEPVLEARAEPAPEPEPVAVPRRSATSKAAQSVEVFQSIIDSDPDDHGIRRRLAEALLEAGDREGGLRELEAAMVGFERADNLDAASSLVDEIVRLNPASVRHHQKRVEYAFKRNERGTLIEAYLQLADALFRAGTLDKSRAIYQRVLDLAPDDARVQAALESFPAPEPEPAPPPAPAPKGRPAAARPAAPAAALASAGDDDFVNLADWMRGDDTRKSTRMVVQEQEPSGDEEADFQDMLRKFKQGIAENIDDEDHQSHYDLGVAYKEMGLLDEAIAEFQKALRAPTNRVPTYEALGQSFMEKEQYPMAATILSRALNEKGVLEDQLVGVLYLLGRCAEERGQTDAAVDYYHRVFVVDIQFRDVGDRLTALEGARR
jgi:tetratricopeptide (TPR) repeat protein